jgi:hypothetical protein
MNRKNFRLLTTLALLGSAQMNRCPGLEYSARAGILGKLVCSEAGVDETDEADTKMPSVAIAQSFNLSYLNDFSSIWLARLPVIVSQ